MNELLRTVYAVLLAIALLSAAMAQDEPAVDDSEAEQVRRYTVEIIIFSYAEDFGLGSEQFYPDKAPDDGRGGTAAASLGLVDEVEVAPARPTVNLAMYAANKDALSFVPLAEDEYTLTDIVDRFELLDAYDTVMHFGWTQPTLPPEYARPVSLRTFGAPPAGLDGSFELYLSRYLHLVVDLAFAAPREESPYAPARSTPSYGDSRPGYEFLGGASDAPVFYRIQDDRIFKNGDIRYFDHPKFGVVAKITRVEETPEEPAGAQPSLGGSRQ